MGFLNTTSIIAAFLAGIAALFAPCCITVLLPSYLGSIFRQKSTVYLMTFIFFLGLLSVFLPIGLSFGYVGKLISQFHDPIFLTGGNFLIFLGVFILLGYHFRLPFTVNQNISKVNPFSVYLLGIFSGLATTCCAPVLAGVMALSVIPGSVFWAGIYTVSYVLGMTVPLFLIASLLDKVKIESYLPILRKPVNIRIGPKVLDLVFSEILSGLIFLAIGIIIIYLTITGNLTTHSSYQLDINLTVASATIFVNKYLGFVPQIGWAVFFVLVTIIVVYVALRKLKE